MSPRSHLEYVLNKWQSKVETILSNYHKSNVRLRLKPDDRLRLLNLKVWCERYKVSPDWLVRFLVNYWRRRSPVKGSIFSTRLSTFCGNVSRQAVELEMQRLYPNGENIKAARSAFKVAMLGMSIPRLRVKDSLKYVNEYRIQLEKTKKRLGSKRFTRRRFRENPFLAPTTSWESKTPSNHHLVSRNSA